MGKRDEYKVHLKDRRGRRSFTLVNATSADEAERVAASRHSWDPDNPKTVIGSEKTGRSF